MEQINTTKARDNFSEIINKTAYAKERIILVRNGKSVAAIIPMDDLITLEELEDVQDLQEARKALKESDERYSYDSVRKEMNL